MLAPTAGVVCVLFHFRLKVTDNNFLPDVGHLLALEVCLSKKKDGADTEGHVSCKIVLGIGYDFCLNFGVCVCVCERERGGLGHVTSKCGD